MPIKLAPTNRHHAKNSRLVDVAKSNIQAVIPIAQQLYDNALQVNGYEILVYNEMKTGRQCSCSRSVDIGPSAPLLDEKGNATQEHIAELLEGSSFKIKRYASRDGAFDGSTIEKQHNILGDTTSHIQDDVSTGTSTLVDDHMNMSEFETPLSSFDNGMCGVCFGTGYVGGFNILGGQRHIIEPDYGVDALSFVEVVKSELPYKWRFNGEALNFSLTNTNDWGFIEWTMTLPYGLDSLDALRVFDNFISLKTPKKLYWYNTLSTNWEPLLSETKYVDQIKYTILADKGKRVKFRLYMPGGTEVTHIEFQYRLSSSNFFAEYPRLTETGDMSLMESMDAVQLVVSPLVIDLKPRDIIVDTVFGKYWKVTNSNYFNDVKRNVLGWDVNARLIQPNEVFRQLPTRKPTAGFKHNQFAQFNRS